jgi:LPS export ABC transporter protein LptC
MVRQKKVQLTFSLLLPVILAFALLPGCKDDAVGPAALPGSQSSALMSAKYIDVVFSDSGRVEARITSPLINRFSGDNPYIEFPKGFRVMLYDSSMTVETTITGDYGRRNEVARTMEAKGNVVVRNEKKNEQLNTEILIWDEKNHRIYSDAPVKITTPTQVLYGKGLESNEQFTNYNILQVKGEMTVKQDSL